MRLVRYFTVLAEQRRFTSAAEQLHITQPSLSRQIRSLERQIGVRLFDRTPRGSRLTEAGEAFLPHAIALLRSANRAAAAARAAEPSRITIGYTGDLLITPAVQALRQWTPDSEVHTLHVGWDRPREALLDHSVDAVVTRTPVSTSGLHQTILFAEPRALVVSVGHRLAGRAAVTIDDIADEPMPQVSDAAWNAFWRIDPRPDGRAAPTGPLARAPEDKMEFVATGEAVAIVPATVRLRPDVVMIPLLGVDPSHVVLVTREGDRNALLTAFRHCIQSHLADHMG